jgi:hypothetical protein
MRTCSCAGRKYRPKAAIRVVVVVSRAEQGGASSSIFLCDRGASQVAHLFTQRFNEGCLLEEDCVPVGPLTLTVRAPLLKDGNFGLRLGEAVA